MAVNGLKKAIADYEKKEVKKSVTGKISKAAPKKHS
jgi:hypothetical protein